MGPRRLFRRLAALALAAAMTLTLSACGEGSLLDWARGLWGGGSGGRFYTGRSEADQQAAFDQLVEELTLGTLEGDYLTAHVYLEDPAAWGVDQSETPLTLLTPMTEEAFDSYLDYLEELTEALEDFDGEALTQEQRELREMLLFDLETQRQFYSPQLRWLGTNFDTYSGWQVTLPTLFGDYVFHSEADLEAFLVLLADTRTSTGYLLDYAREQQARGCFSADCAAVEAYCREVAAQGAESSVLADIQENIAALGLGAEATAQYQARAEEIFLESFIPAYEDMAGAMAQLAQGEVYTGGLAGLEHGREYYAALVRQYASSSRSPEELMDLLGTLAEEAFADLAGVVRRDPELAERWERGEIGSGYDDFEEMLSALEGFVFQNFPRVDLPAYTVDVIDPTVAADSVAAYFNIPPVDSTHPWSIMVNSADGSLDRSSLETWCTVAHEGMPGHLYQTACAYANLEGDLSSLVLLDFSGYSEGYATYAELMSLYYLDLEEDAVTLQRSYTILLNSLIAQADIGVHYLGWDLEELEEWNETYGMFYAGALYEAICQTPGVYLSYYAGYLEFHLLRQEAEEALGAAFDPVEFHRALLEGGALSFDVLRARMDRWLEEETMGLAA